MRTRALLATGTLVCAFAMPARADETQVCSDAYTQGQTLRNEHKLIKSREQLRVCTRAECTWRATECAKWLTEVETALPSIVFEVKNGKGDDVSDVKVSIDGAPLVDRLDGSALVVDPGEHTFRFEATGESAVEKKVVVREGEKGRRIPIMIGSSQRAEPKGDAPRGVPESPASAGSTQRTIGLVVGGVGVVGLGFGTVFGLIAGSKWSDAQNKCTPSACGSGSPAQDDKSAAQNAATISTILFVAGGAALATGAVIFFTAPRSATEKDSVGVSVAPSLGGVVVRGWF
jgi:hypothetical protein